MAYPLYDHQGTSIAEIWPEEADWTEPFHEVDFDAFGVKRKGSFQTVTRLLGDIWDRIAGLFESGHDPQTDTQAYQQDVPESWAFDVDGVEPSGRTARNDLQIDENQGPSTPSTGKPANPTIRVLGPGRVGVFAADGTKLGEINTDLEGEPLILRLQLAGYTPEQIANVFLEAHQNGAQCDDVVVDQNRSIIMYHINTVRISLGSNGGMVVSDRKTFSQLLEADGTRTTYVIPPNGEGTCTTMSPDGTIRREDVRLGNLIWQGEENPEIYSQMEVFDLLENPSNMIIIGYHLYDPILTVSTSTHPDGSTITEHRNPFNATLIRTITINTESDGTVKTVLRDAQGNVETVQTVKDKDDGTQIINQTVTVQRPEKGEESVEITINPDGSSVKTFTDIYGNLTDIRYRHEEADGTVVVKEVEYTYDIDSILREDSPITKVTTGKPDGVITSVYRDHNDKITGSETTTPLPGGGNVNELMDPHGTVIYRTTVDSEGYVVSIEKLNEYKD